jgi:hypothetical protein
MPESGKTLQAIECQADIRMQLVPCSVLLMFEIEQPSAKNAQMMLMNESGLGRIRGRVIPEVWGAMRSHSPN